MTHALSPAMAARIDDAELRPVYLIDITIGSTTYHLTDRETDVVSNGITYLPAAFQVSQISRSRDGISQVTITMSNADKTGTDWLAANEIRGCNVVISIVEQDDLDDAVVYFPGLIDSIPQVSRTQFSVTIRGREDFFEHIPKRTFSPRCNWVYKPSAGGTPTICPATGSVSSTTWAASTAKSKGDIVTPTTPNGVYYYAKNGGTTDATEPTWSETNGALIVDNDITWFAFLLTVCGKSATDCRARTGSSAKFGGFLPWQLR